jgi:glycine dehydrogenase
MILIINITPMAQNQFSDRFIDRHIGPGESEINEMLKVIGADSLESLIDDTIPENIRNEKSLKSFEAMNEQDFLKKLNEKAKKNKIFKTYIGLGYHPVILPRVIQRNILENPGWYTQYTPYQAEISQGRLEALFTYQTLVSDMTGLPIANASLLDEGTAAAEAMLMAHYHRKNKNADIFYVSDKAFKQTIDVIITRAEPQNIKVKIASTEDFELNDNVFGIFVQTPDIDGKLTDYTQLFESAKLKNIFTIIASELMSLVLFKSAGEMGADIAVGSTQRFGVPMMYGGPHAAYFATKDEYKRFIPGRIIGLSIDNAGNPAFRMSLQTREQHIKREKATSNICTAQVLLAIMASMYAVYHGPCGLTGIAERIFRLTSYLRKKLSSIGLKFINDTYFDTATIDIKDKQFIEKVKSEAIKNEVNFRIEENLIGISLNETTSLNDVNEIISIFENVTGKKSDNKARFDNTIKPDESLARKTEFLTHKIFNRYYSEMEFMRYMKSLENKDLSLTGSMIPLGSCTMKLNAAVEMAGLTMPEFTEIHPFAPEEQAQGYIEMINELGDRLLDITGFSGITFQPNAGAQGEYTGLMIIRKYHLYNGDDKRNVVLIPESAHGTNPASAVMAGNNLVIVACDKFGNIDIDDLKKKAEENRDTLSALMVTYPSTHGVFEENIIEICKIIHDCGGQVYMDGANMNAQVGYTSPLSIGADVCHLNLHKTFAIPHGGGGPGVGPVAVAEHLVKFLPGHVYRQNGKDAMNAVSSAYYGSAGVLSIPYAYVLLSGSDGLKRATAIAILNANYIKEALKDYYPTLYTGAKGRVAHEMILDVRQFKATTKVDVEDIAKRLMDYGFHAPTVSFPVHGTLMVEPTESESKYELDRFIDAMISIRKEIDKIEKGNMSKEDNMLLNAPHTALEVTKDDWTHPYSRREAAFPVESLKRNKFWASVGRINNAYGDRNLVCKWQNEESK